MRVKADKLTRHAAYRLERLQAVLAGRAEMSQESSSYATRKRSTKISSSLSDFRAHSRGKFDRLLAVPLRMMSGPARDPSWFVVIEIS